MRTRVPAGTTSPHERNHDDWYPGTRVLGRFGCELLFSINEKLENESKREKIFLDRGYPSQKCMPGHRTLVPMHIPVPVDGTRVPGYVMTLEKHKSSEYPGTSIGVPA